MHNKFKLHVGIALAFVLATIPLFTVVIGYLYINNTRLALETASQSMEQASIDVAESFNTLLAPVSRIVDASAVVAKLDHSGLRRVDGLRLFYDQIEKLPYMFSFFIGFESDGGFYQVVRRAKEQKSIGADEIPWPEGSHYALRLLDASSGRRANSYIFLAGWGDITGLDRRHMAYDPRQRSWYKSAAKSDDVIISNVYFLSSARRPGFAVSRRVSSDSGLLIGVVGVDVTLDSIGTFLDRKRIGENGRAVLIDAEGRQIARSGVLGDDMSEALVAAESSEDPVIAQAVRTRKERGTDHFTMADREGRRFMVSFRPFNPTSGAYWQVGIIAEEDNFTGPIRETTLRIVAVGLLMLALALIAIFLLARRLTISLRRISDEAARIRDFDLSSKFVMSSRIDEVQNLGDTIANMKTSLRNFSVYVPKDLVRSIVASGQEATIGGERRPLTIMFSDIEDFTKRSEALLPEDVLGELSLYFQAMSDAIQCHHGIIDKFIGDSVMAIWNAPREDAHHAVNACRAILACQNACERLNAEHQNGKLLPLVTRFGLHGGEVMVGNSGAAERMQYTVLGAAVNLASRIESLNKVYGTKLLVSESVVAATRDSFLFRHVDLVSPAGTTQGIRLFELMAEQSERIDPILLARHADWEACQSLYFERRWDDAASAFKAYMAAHGDEKLAKLYVQRCETFTVSPPPPDWSGIQSFDSK
ncbi:adenylate/guanylate cyclase domain-containing protein [Paramagnetospirillum kuznetsovii]|uniref:Adenylate/guanylate cyclase domain-containing protein n=1 Tax=Paramagnetospirillum kuznetsovii TaxID=2053833 RepID=A0A364NYD7_9PROT|nr:adenylate/guanylate cyclase domain-containing protein [Paramagnetospirillum kuznetsovii]RAU21927.1 adenylate/guanylate cyclase domain-containing protein [Paramagnetospirillum kuznetsovii]